MAVTSIRPLSRLCTSRLFTGLALVSLLFCTACNRRQGSAAVPATHPAQPPETQAATANSVIVSFVGDGLDRQDESELDNTLTLQLQGSTLSDVRGRDVDDESLQRFLKLYPDSSNPSKLTLVLGLADGESTTTVSQLSGAVTRIARAFRASNGATASLHVKIASPALDLRDKRGTAK